MSRQLAALLRRALASQSPDLLQTWFRASVLDAYRSRQGFSVIRTDTVGRLRQEGAWSVDFGIGPGDAVIHLSWRDLLNKIPEAERQAWIESVEAPPASINFMQMQLAPGSCLDDGELRPW